MVLVNITKINIIILMQV